MVLKYVQKDEGDYGYGKGKFQVWTGRQNEVNMQKRVTNSQWYLFNTNPDTNHNANPTNANSNCKW